jgi:type VI protein secretion system component VasF
MTELDQLLSRLRRLEPIALDGEFKAQVAQRGRRRLRVPLRSAPFASLLVLATVVVYLGWALHFTSGLYP